MLEDTEVQHPIQAGLEHEGSALTEQHLRAEQRAVALATLLHLHLVAAAQAVVDLQMALLEMAVLAILAEAEVAAVLHIGHQEMYAQALVELAAVATFSSYQCKENQ